MYSAFHGIELGKRGLMGHNVALETVGHNLSNASTEGYSRQRVQLKPTDPLFLPGLNREETPGQLGQGMEIASISRVKDMLLEGRIVAQANGQGYWAARDKYMLMLEQVYNEPTDASVRNLMDKFWDSWEELSLYPDQKAARQTVLRNGQALMDGVHARYSSLKTIRTMLNDDVKVTVGEINQYLDDIAALNEQIVKIEAVGDNPNDYLDRRDLLVKKLSSLMNVTIDNRDPDEFNMHTSGFQLIQGRVVNKLDVEPDPLNESYARVVWDDAGRDDVFLRGGKLAAIMELRDQDLREAIQSLDNMTINFTDLVNEVHRDGFALNGETGQSFFTEYPAIDNINGNYDRSGDGNFDSSYVFRMTGSNQLDGQAQIGLRGAMVFSGPQEDITVQYYPADTVDDIIKRINNSGAEVVARLDRNDRLMLKATPAANKENPDFVIRHVEDSGEFLAAYSGILNQAGENGAYDWGGPDAVLNLRGGETQYTVAPLTHPAGWIEIDRDLLNDPTKIAAGFGDNGRPLGPRDGSAAVAIADLRNSNIMLGKLTNFDDYFAEVVAETGLKGEVAQNTLETQDVIMKELEDMRQSISGVNIDEELAEMIKYQHGYQAAARFISSVDRMLDTIINRMGV